MQCPKCRAPISSAPDPGGYMLCPACGARLMSRATKPKESPPTPAPTPPPVPVAGLADHPPEETLPAGAPERKKKPGEDTARSTGRTPAVAAGAPEASAAPFTSPYEEILRELRALRETQDEILELLRSGAGSSAADSEPGPVSSAFEGFHSTVPGVPEIRSRRRKSVLLIDDDPATRQAAVAAFERAEVPVRAAPDGNAGLEAIALDKPDVIVLELALYGDMAGKDVINMIKATMEWVDIPIVLYTRAVVDSQKEARTTYGADEYVLKSTGPEGLVSLVIALFRSK